MPTSRLSKLTPICLSAVRFISATRTLSVTWSGVAMRRRLTGRILSATPSFVASMPGLRAERTSSSAWAASSGEATVPLITATWPMVVTLMSEPGIASRRISFIELMFWFTRTLAP